MLKIDVDDKDLQRGFRAMRKRVTNASPLMSEIGEIMLASVERNFDVQGRFLNTAKEDWRGGNRKWVPLAASTIERRERRGHWPGKVLQETGGLAASVSKTVRSTSVDIGSNKKYARIQQLGGQTGRGHATTIPPRKYLTVQVEDVSAIDKAVEHHLQV